MKKVRAAGLNGLFLRAEIQNHSRGSCGIKKTNTSGKMIWGLACQYLPISCLYQILFVNEPSSKTVLQLSQCHRLEFSHSFDIGLLQ
jgi:hypothetical protein